VLVAAAQQRNKAKTMNRLISTRSVVVLRSPMICGRRLSTKNDKQTSNSNSANNKAPRRPKMSGKEYIAMRKREHVFLDDAAHRKREERRRADQADPRFWYRWSRRVVANLPKFIAFSSLSLMFGCKIFVF
jgi:hypothetical protein